MVCTKEITKEGAIVLFSCLIVALVYHFLVTNVSLVPVKKESIQCSKRSITHRKEHAVASPLILEQS